MTKQDALEQIRKTDREILKYREEIQTVEEFRESVIAAVKQAQKKKYAPLMKAYEEYGERWTDIENAYGYDMISKAKYEKLGTLKSQMERDRTAELMKDVVAFITRRVASLSSYLEKLNRDKAYYETLTRDEV